MAESRKIIQALRDELRLQIRHRKLLQEQQRALLACDRPRFCRLQEEHALMLCLIESQEAARRTALDRDGEAQTLTAALGEMPERDARSVRALRQSLRGELERVNALSAQNHKLIQNELDYIAFTLDLFVEAGRKAERAYGGRGAAGGRLMLDRRA